MSEDKKIVKEEDQIQIDTFLELAKKHDLLTRGGAYYKYCDVVIGRNVKEITEYMNKNEPVFREIVSRIEEAEGITPEDPPGAEIEEEVPLKAVLPTVERYPEEEEHVVELKLLDVPDSEVVAQYYEETKDMEGAIKRPRALRKWLSCFYSSAYQRIGGEDCSTENLYRLALQHKDMIPNDDYIVKHHGIFETNMEQNRFLAYVCIMRIDEREEREALYEFFQRVETGIAIPIFMPSEFIKTDGSVDFEKFKQEADINHIKNICASLKIRTHNLEGGAGNASREKLIGAIIESLKYKSTALLEQRSKLKQKKEGDL